MSRNHSGNPKARLIVLAVVLAFYLIPAVFGFLFSGLENLADALDGGSPQAFLSLDDAAVQRDSLGPDGEGNIILLLSMDLSNHGSGSTHLDEYTVSVRYTDAEGYTHYVDDIFLAGDEEPFLPAGRSTGLDYLFQVPDGSVSLVLDYWSGMPGAEGGGRRTIPLE